MKKDDKKHKGDVGDLLGNVFDELFDKLGEAFYKGLTQLFKKAHEYLIKQKEIDFNEEIFDKPKIWKDYSAAGYSRGTDKEVYFDEIDFKRSTMVVGATGSGKNVLVMGIIEHILQKGEPVLFIAPKGDQYDILQFKRLNEIYDRDCYVFSPSYEDSQAFNPIADGTVHEIHDRIIDSYHWTEPYYKEIASQALRIAIENVKESGNEVTFERIAAEIDLQESELDKRDRDKLLGLKNKLISINHCSTSHLLNQDGGMTFSKLRKEKASLYIELPNLSEPVLSRLLGKIFLSSLSHHTLQVLNRKTTQNCTEPNLFVLIDEFASFCQPEFCTWLAQCRGANISALMALQSTSQLKDLGEGFKESILANTLNYLIGLIISTDESEDLAGLVGTKKGEKTTVRVEEGVYLDVGSARDVNQYYINPNIIRGLTIGRFIVHTKFENLKKGYRKITDIVDFNLRLTEDYIDHMLKKKRANQANFYSGFHIAKKNRSIFTEKFETFEKYQELTTSNKEPIKAKRESRPDTINDSESIKLEEKAPQRETDHLASTRLTKFVNKAKEEAVSIGKTKTYSKNSVKNLGKLPSKTKKNKEDNHKLGVNL